MKKWYALLAIGIVIVSLSFTAWFAFPKKTYWTGEYIETYEGTGLVKEYRTSSAQSNPYWVKEFQASMPVPLVMGFILLGIGVQKVVSRGYD